VLEDTVEPDQEHLEHLQERLKGRWILRVAALAADLGLAEAQIASLAARYPQVVGYLAGPPDLVFLHPEGVQRE
jgi:hypothetical protein